MISTKDYKTKTIFRDIQMPVVSPDDWCIGLDIGYSGVKAFSPNSITCFPSFATESSDITQISFGYAPEDDMSIQYKDDEGSTWIVGAAAQDTISASDTSAGSLAAYGRHRYFSPMFLVLFRTGIASAMRVNAYGNPQGKKIVLQTGLPPKYLNDATDFKSVILGNHHFWVKFGAREWQEFNVTFTEDNICNILSQPMGTVFSIAVTKDMKPSMEAGKYFNSKILIVDAGFGTLDLCPMRKKIVDLATCETDANLGMKRVILETINDIQTQYGFEVTVPAMQQYLESGMVPAKVGKTYKKAAFADILERNSRKVCYQAIDKIMNTYDLTEYQYVIITGGTGAAWSNFIREHEFFKGNDVTKVVSGNQGDPSLPYIFTNARGYYMYALVGQHS